MVAFVGNDNTTSTENMDRKTLALPGKQMQLLEQLCKANKNVVVVILPSGSTTIGKAQDMADGIICGWANGQEQGNAIARVLFGDVNPGGKLNTTWFRSDGDLPDINDYNIRNNRTYMYFTGEPLYPYGYGLSYTTFKLSNLKLNSSVIAKNSKIKVSVDVTNTGDVAGDEVVQLYIRDKVSDNFVASKKLKGFERVYLDKGETKTVTIILDHNMLANWDSKVKNFVVSNGEFDICIGNSSANIPLSKTVRVEGGVVPEHSLRTVSYADYHNNERYRSQYYGGKLLPIAKESVNEKKGSTVQKNKAHWYEYFVKFVDPGFYVSEWDVIINYTSTKANTKVSIEYDGQVVAKDIILDKAGSASQKISVPKPEYDMSTRFRLNLEHGVEITSIDVVWPKDKSVVRYKDPVDNI